MLARKDVLMLESKKKAVMQMKELKTPRLVLRRLRKEDSAAFFRFAGSETVTKYMFWKPHKDVEESAASIEKTLLRYETGNCWRWGIALGETDELIGIIDLLGINETDRSCTFAYMIAEDFWGRGFAAEALSSVLGFAFERLGLKTVWGEHFGPNGASGAVMRKAGMKYIGTELGKYEKCGEVFDVPQYRITREEWENRNS